MANRIKSISKYSGSAWGTETPIGADAANVDLATSYTTVTESTATSGATAEAAIGKIHTDTTNLKKAGHGNGTVTNYDSTSSETSKVLTTDCVVAATDDTATAWSKFNRFRRRVSNKFADYFLTSNLITSSTGVTTTGADTTVYTSKAINNYLANVIGYTDSTAPSAGTIASQLSSLNNNFTKNTCYDAWNLQKTSGSRWQSGEIVLLQHGRVVQIKVNGATINAGSDRTYIAEIPAKYMPQAETGFILDGTSTWAFVGSGSTGAGAHVTYLAINPTTSNTMYWGSCMFLIHVTAWLELE